MMIKSRTMRWTGHAALMGEMRKTYKVLDNKPEGKKIIERPRCRWENH
jgi:hypothetical protein